MLHKFINAAEFEETRRFLKRNQKEDVQNQDVIDYIVRHQYNLLSSRVTGFVSFKQFSADITFEIPKLDRFAQGYYIMNWIPKK